MTPEAGPAGGRALALCGAAAPRAVVPLLALLTLSVFAPALLGDFVKALDPGLARAVEEVAGSGSTADAAGCHGA